MPWMNIILIYLFILDTDVVIGNIPAGIQFDVP